MREKSGKGARWMDVVWLLFLAGLAALPPVSEIHKQLTLLAIGVVQLVENRLVRRFPRQGRHYAVLLKILLATLLIAHTGGPEINSSYYPIYYLPIVTAAVYFGPRLTLFWTLMASAAYCSFLYPALEEYELTPEGVAELAIRILFFFLAALVVNRFVMENRRQTEELAETNRQLRLAQAEARRSERLAALGQLSAGLAHEIRNPLGVIKGSAEMLNQKLESSNPLAGELAGYISSEVNRLSVLVSRFLDFARPLRTETRPQAIPELLDRALKDTGPGIPAELREQIFNPFVTTKKSGVGLGLSIVSKIVDEHRGWLRLESPPNEGACFVVFLPLEEHAAPQEGAQAAG